MKLDVAQQFDMNWINSGDIKRILLLRTARMWQFQSVAKQLKSAFPSAKIDILCQPSVWDACQEMDGVSMVVKYPAERLLLRNLTLRMLFDLRRSRYDLVVIVYNNVYGEGYRDVHLLSRLIRGRRLLAYNLDAHWLNAPDADWRPLRLTVAAPLLSALFLLYFPFGLLRSCKRRTMRRALVPAYRATRE